MLLIRKIFLILKIIFQNNFETFLTMIVLSFVLACEQKRSVNHKNSRCMQPLKKCYYSCSILVNDTVCNIPNVLVYV